MTLTARVHPGAAGVALQSPAILRFDAPSKALRAIARKVDAWLAARRRVAADRAALASMSDRELIDIGLDRAHANAIAGDFGDAQLRAWTIR